MFDVLIIGAGITGCFIARELSKYNLNVLVVEKNNDVGNETTSANSAIVHSGYDPLPGSLKAKLNVEGNAMFDKVCEELDVSFKRIGSITVALDEKEVEILESLQERAKQNGVETILLSKEELFNKIVTYTAGRAAEEIVFNSITTGAHNDISQATKIARLMISQYGMSDEFDMVALEHNNNLYLDGDASLNCSAETQTLIDKKVIELIKKAHDKAKSILLEHKGKLDILAKHLYERETITGEEFIKHLDS